MKKIEYDPFCLRQFEPKASGTRIPMEIKDELLEIFNDFLFDVSLIDSDNNFCKYLVIPNDFQDIKTAIIPLSLDVHPFIQTDYIARTADELPVLTRVAKLPTWYKRPAANYLCAILYTREQLRKEFYSKDENVGKEFYLDEEVEYGIVAIQGTVQEKPDPYVPITMMRNALGMEEGGNGVPLNRESYLESVEFWRNHILIG